ncbi:MAG TPA: amino acid adenylation domain-containing protein, partial [Mycobacteriales bacterium]|nr:amino acid adenylation domain-containing protein [Mycobacteriales bacterium]
AGPGDLAYVIYTSGSTGEPKGVEVPHRGLDNLVRWHLAAYGLGPGDACAHLAGTAFDASVWEIWPALSAGATLHLADAATQASPAELVRWLVERRITVTFLPTPLAELAVREPWPAGTALRFLLTGGDTLQAGPPPGLPFELVNHYGPTESSVVATAGAVPPERGDDGPRRPPPIGRPIAGLRAYVLDADGRPVPPYVPGELHVGGAGLARGYLGRPELTEQRFRPDPYGAPGERLYRTGDLVSWRDDGALDFHGRIDTQVKLRGIRIELGEVESTLAAHPDVTEAAVLLREDTPGHQQLVGYVAGPAAEPDAVRGWLADRLPAHLVPAVLVPLATLPLTRNGKVDRRALPAPVPGPPPAAAEPLRDATERAVAEVWSQLLGVPADRIGALDDFFSLGGTSLAATRGMVRLRARLGTELPLAAVLADPTVRGVARSLAAAAAAAAAGAAERPAPAPVRRAELMPVTAAQRQMWMVDRLDDGITYNVPITVDLAGPLRPELLAAALTTIVARHEALRTTIVLHDGRPMQRVAPAPNGVELPVLDVPDPGEAEAAVRELARRPLDVATGPVWRAALLRRGPQDHQLALVVHHVAFDGWSLGVVCAELAQLYRAGLEGRAAELPELPVQPADLAVWEAAHGQPGDADLDFWRQQLAGVPARIELPTDLPRPAVASADGGRRVATLGPELTEALTRLAQDAGTTPYVVLLAGFAALLSRHGGGTDVVVGSPAAGRLRPELEPLVGCFINTLPLRVDLAGDPGFRELLGRLRRTTLDAQRHQEAPLDRIVDAARPDRGSGADSPLFRVVFALEDAHAPRFALGDVAAAVTEVDFGAARSDLGLSVTPVDGGLRLCAEYRSQLFTPAAVDRLLTQYATLLAGAVTAPDTPVPALPLLTAAERDQLLHGWNDTARPYPDDTTVTALIERQVDATPGAVAVVFEDVETVTYAQLDRRANRLAHHLRGLGVGPESRVAICMHRSPEMIVAILGVLKAGGGYVPLDPAAPRDRLEFIAADAGVQVLLTQSGLRDRMGPGAAVAVELDRAAELERWPDTRPEPVNGPRDLAYVIYTSGSTGRPKGVMIEHRSVCNFMATVHELFEMGPHDRVLQFASLGFDVSVFEIFSALTCGARLCLARQETLLSVKDLSAFMQRQEISVMDMPPTVMSLLPGDAFPALRIAFVGGEAFSGGLVNRWAVPGRRFFNGYGPTEGTVTVIVEECSGDGWETSPPIGRPMPNMRAHVLDPAGQLLGVGMPGELVIGGAGLARGYLDRPELTAEKFIPDPYSADPDERLYRTGDLVRRLPDGRLDFLGRIDHQVKLRGFRIELGEIETALRAHPMVGEAVVLLREDTPGHRRLVGYVAGATGAAAPDAAELGAHLAARLPAYMVPAAIVVLDALPLNASGKVDRAALPVPAASAPTGDRPVPPRTRRERTLAEIWGRLLGAGDVGVHDSFFSLGGHSILAVQLVWEVSRAFGVDISIKDVFERPTIAGLAVVVEDAMLAALAAGGDRPPAPAQTHPRQETL